MAARSPNAAPAARPVAIHKLRAAAGPVGHVRVERSIPPRERRDAGLPRCETLPARAIPPGDASNGVRPREHERAAGVEIDAVGGELARLSSRVREGPKPVAHGRPGRAVPSPDALERVGRAEEA